MPAGVCVPITAFHSIAGGHPFTGLPFARLLSDEIQITEHHSQKVDAKEQYLTSDTVFFMKIAENTTLSTNSSECNPQMSLSARFGGSKPTFHKAFIYHKTTLSRTAITRLLNSTLTNQCCLSDCHPAPRDWNLATQTILLTHIL